MKAILVIDMPEKCKNCDLYIEDKYADYICSATLEYVNGNEKPINCPLKPMPYKKIHIGKYNVWEIAEEDKEILVENRGYNKCIDEILGDTK